MALSDVRLSILAFPQSWGRRAGSARLLLLPAGDPDFAAGVQACRSSRARHWPLRAIVLPGLDIAAWRRTPGATPGALPFTFVAVVAGRRRGTSSEHLPLSFNPAPASATGACGSRKLGGHAVSASSFRRAT